MLTHPSWHFSRDYISTLKGCWPLKFWHALKIDQGSLVHTPNWAGCSLQNVNDEHLKLGLKLNTRVPITLGLVAITPGNCTRRRATRQGDNVGTNFGGVPQRNLGWRKKFKIWCDFWQLSNLITNIPQTYRHIENLKNTWVTTSHPLFGEKNFLNFAPLTKKL